MRFLDEKRIKMERKGIKITIFILFTLIISLVFAFFTPAFATCNEFCGDLWVEIPTGVMNITKTVKIIPTDTEFTADISRSAPTLLSKSADQGDNETLPEEYGEFIDSLPDGVIDSLPEGALEGNGDATLNAAKEASGVAYLLGVIFDAFGSAIGDLLPIFALLCGIIILSAVSHAFASNVGAGLSSAVTFSARLCSYCAISGLAVSSLTRLSDFFDSLCTAVGSFLPLTAVLYAMGGNLTSAASGTATLSAILAICQLFLTKTVIPVFCVCLSLTLLGVFDGVGSFAGQSVALTVKKWYTTALGFVMMILTTALAAQTILSVKADNAAMRGVKFAASSFIPISGGAVSSTLGTLAASVELIRGSVGVIGIIVILLLLVPVIIELALLRGIFSLTSFISGTLGCAGEQKLLTEISSLYGYLEGIAALASAIFVIAFAIFASVSAAV